MKPAVFHDRAKAELDEAVDWYERRRVGLGTELKYSVGETVRQICKNPHAGSRYRATKFRYVLVRRFPYVVYYSEGTQAIQITAVAHGSRRPGFWKSRSDP